MLTLSDEVRNIYDGQSPRYFKQVKLYRRHWNGSAYEYAAALDLTSDVKEVGSIPVKLDTEEYNKWGFSNCTVTFRNDRGQWQEGNPDGYFPDNYDIFNSKITIISGVLKVDGTPDPQSVYTGYLTDDSTTYPEDRTAQVTLMDRMTVFSQFSAETIGMVVTNELLGSDSGTEFTTDYNAVGIITTVKKGITSAGPDAATALLADKDYTVSDLNLHDSPGKITLNAALTAGYSVWETYTHWYLDKTLEWIVAQLCATSGITDTKISPAVFASSAKSTWKQETLDDFQQGTLSSAAIYHTPYPDPSVAVYTPYVTNGNYISPAIDGTTSLTHWGQFNAVYGGISGTTNAFSWRESDDGANWGAWNSINPGDTLPATKRYVQFRWEGTQIPHYGEVGYSAYLHFWSVDYYFNTVTIPVVNMTGLTCADAVSELAKMCSYEIGFNGSDTFIFRPRISISSPVAVFDDVVVESVLSVSSGTNRVYNRVNVNYGDYNVVVDSNTQGEAQPNSIDRQGVRSYDISSGNFLPAENVDLAYAIAPTVYTYVSGQRRRVRVKTRYYIHHEIGDIIQMKLSKGCFLKLWKWGDGVCYGDSIVYWNDDYIKDRLPLYLSIFRIEGVEPDPENKFTIFDLTEVL
ncbi:MAG: hypothetical protein PHP45_06805 [Elusimicrobiales bacterium]|nr:hypothetical protein [Elusimicrobiales bacterium]